MKISLRINRHTTESELVHLGRFFTSLGLNRGARVASGCASEPTFTVPPDEAELSEPDTTIIPADDVQAQAPAEVPAGTEAPKRRRRTKEEVAAACTTAAVTNEASHTEPAIAADPEPATVGNDQAAPIQTVPVTDTVVEPAAPAAVSESPSEPAAPTGPITHAEAQKQAIDVARRFGPEKVKAIIAEYEGVGKIADLKDADLVGFVAKLQALAA